MKIDVHVHTKKTKKGDAKTREIDALRFHEIISSTDVEIVAITNHNHFNLTQYNDFTETVGGDFQIWPGVELDILEDDRRGHLLVIVSPKHAQSMESIMSALTKDTTPDDFCISIDSVISNFDKLNPLYIVHYKKMPDLLDKDVEKIIAQTSNKSRVLKEATNSISAGIFLSHGHSSIYGTDIQDWDEYQALSKDLPDLRLPVESFEQFCLLLNRDQTAINTLLDKKEPEKISIRPFEDRKLLEIRVYNDINVFFGAKGTGKSKILEAIAGYYASKGISANKFESGSLNLADHYDLKGKKVSIALADYGIDYCEKEIDLIKRAVEKDVTSLSRYLRFFSKTITNIKAKKIKVKDFSTENINIHERKFESVNAVHKKFKEFKAYLEEDNSVKKIVEESNLSALVENLTAILDDLDEKRLKSFVEQKVVYLFNSLIEKVNYEVSRKIGTPKKPITTGFIDYASNRIKIEVAAKSILKNIRKKIEIPSEYVGSLGEKGVLYCKTEIRFQDGSIHDSDFKPIVSVNKEPQKKFSKVIKSINADLYSTQLFEQIAELKSIESVDSIPTILELLVFNKYFTINEESYDPSTGESSMLLLHKELKEDKDVYILDEPEKSLGNEYISNVIVPLIKEKAKIGKKIFIATHDANIAVRTLPYNSVFREHKKGGSECETFVGNPFINHLINIKDISDQIDWKEISLRTLEGGKGAFGERGQIYGNP
jgi:predicted ATPase